MGGRRAPIVAPFLLALARPLLSLGLGAAPRSGTASFFSFEIRPLTWNSHFEYVMAFIFVSITVAAVQMSRCKFVPVGPVPVSYTHLTLPTTPYV